MESIKCPGCGATLTYNLADEELRCDYCGNICIIKEDQITDAEYIRNRLMDVHKTSCPGCGARLMTNINTASSSCAYCGSSIIYDEKVNKVFKPKKIILYEIGLDEVKEKVKKYFAGSDFASKNDILSVLKPIYLPYWLYRCTYQSDGQTVECNNILADASSKIDDNLADKVDGSFDLSKLKDFDISNIAGFYAEEFDDTFKGMNGRINKKIEEKVGTPVDDNCISNAKSMYIQLPVYYGEINGLKILVNGQNGTIAINSEQYLKTVEQIRRQRVEATQGITLKEILKYTILMVMTYTLFIIIICIYCNVIEDIVTPGKLIISLMLIIFSSGTILREGEKGKRFINCQISNTKNKNKKSKILKSYIGLAVWALILYIALVLWGAFILYDLKVPGRAIFCKIILFAGIIYMITCFGFIKHCIRQKNKLL